MQVFREGIVRAKGWGHVSRVEREPGCHSQESGLRPIGRRRHTEAVHREGMILSDLCWKESPSSIK